MYEPRGALVVSSSRLCSLSLSSGTYPCLSSSTFESFGVLSSQSPIRRRDRVILQAVQESACSHDSFAITHPLRASALENSGDESRRAKRRSEDIFDNNVHHVSQLPKPISEVRMNNI